MNDLLKKEPETKEWGIPLPKVLYMIWEYTDCHSGTIMAQVDKLDGQLEKLGLSIMEDSEGSEVIRGFYDEDNVKDLYELLGREMINTKYSLDGDVDIIDIDFADKSTLKLEFI